MRPLLLILSLLFAANICRAQPGEYARKKMPPALASLKRPPDKELENIFWITASNIDSLKKHLLQINAGVKMLSEFPHTNLLVIRTSWRNIDSGLALLPLVRFIEVPRLPKEERALNAFDNSINSINLLHHYLPALNGNGMVVSVKENLFDTTDIDFKGRYLPTPQQSNQTEPHATIMATIVAGTGNSFYTSKGAAWGSTISSSDFASLLPDTGDTYERYNISVQNHSYGVDIENYYGADAAAYDATLIENPSLLHIFSAGNDGDKASTSGTYTGITGLANLTGSFKMAKNIITAGAVDSFGVVAPLSSKGPAYDGRIKPELVAFGQDGSSGAAAITSGIALLVQQAYKEIHAGNLPPAALTKAVLINTATDIENPGPDYVSGFGIVDGYKAVNSILQQQFFSGKVSNGQLQEFEINIPADACKLTLTLCWSDPPATANAPTALINDLDLEITNLSSLEKWQPWVLSSFPLADSLLKPAHRTRDSVNNVEQISIDNPAAGDYRIAVRGYFVSTSQAWSLAWHIDTANRFYWQYPAASDHLEANQKNIIRWSSTFDNSLTGTLEYSLDKGHSWTVLQNNINLQQKFFAFNAPDTYSPILFRMTVNNQFFISDTSVVARPLDLRVGFNCPDSVLLYWNRANGVSEYQLWQLGDRYLEPFASTSDSFIVFNKSASASMHYTVAPVIEPGKTGIRAHTIDYSQQGVECYIKNFLADLTGSAVLLSLELGTLHNVKEIVWEKLKNGQFVSLSTTVAGGSPLFTYTDNDLQKGGNAYRATIVLQNGQRIYTPTETIYYFNNSPYLIFPNPVSRTAALQIHSPDLQPRLLVLYNSSGQQVKQVMITGLVSAVTLPGLSKGVYFIMILKEGKKDYSGHLVVQ